MQQLKTYRELQQEVRRLRTKVDVLQENVMDCEGAKSVEIERLANAVEKAGIAFSQANLVAGEVIASMDSKF